jgi:hypothetical protein
MMDTSKPANGRDQTYNSGRFSVARDVLLWPCSLFGEHFLRLFPAAEPLRVLCVGGIHQS